MHVLSLLVTPVFIWPELIDTARSASQVSSVSPDLSDTWTPKLSLKASCAASRASLRVPIWFTLRRTAFAAKCKVLSRGMDLTVSLILPDKDQRSPTSKDMKKEYPDIISSMYEEEKLDREIFFRSRSTLFLIYYR